MLEKSKQEPVSDGAAHRTRFDAEIVPGMDEIPREWEPLPGRLLRRSGQTESRFPDGHGRQHRAYEHHLRLPSVPGSRDAFKLNCQIWYQPPGASVAPERAAHGPAFAPSLVVLRDGTVLIVFRFEGLRKLPQAGTALPTSGEYLRLREGGGASVGYAFRFPDGRWQHGYVARAQELLIHDCQEPDPNRARLYPAFETLGPPALGLDCHGVPWCLWANPARRHVYFARWLGPAHGFSDPLEARGAYYALAEPVALEAQMPSSAPNLLGMAQAAGRVYLFSLPVPSLATASPRRVFMLDLLEIAWLEGVVHRLGQPARRPENPIINPETLAQAQGSGLRPLGAPRVWRHEGRLRMELSPRGPMGGAAVAVLESDDGLAWRLIPQAVPAIDGKRATGAECAIAWFIDHSEPDVHRRYKGALVRGDWRQSRRRWLVTSGDALHWSVEGEMAGMHFLKEGSGPTYYDPLTGDYAAIGRTSASGGRALGMLRSRDLLHWEGEEALLDLDDPYGRPALLWRGQYLAGRILDPAGEQGGEQIYWGTVWPLWPPAPSGLGSAVSSATLGDTSWPLWPPASSAQPSATADNAQHDPWGFYLCLYGRYRWNGSYDVALAVSRDGRHFTRVKPGEPLLPCGAPGEWDSGIVFMDFGALPPVHFPEQGIVRLYYAGSSWHHGTDPYRVPAAIGAADLQEDGWAYLCPAPEASLPAQITTIPIESTGPARLHVSSSGPLRWEALDARTGVPLPGLPERGSFCLRFALESHTSRLFSFWFEPVEPA